MKNILFVTPYFAPAWGYGGPPRINYDLARYLADHGHSVEVATTDALDGQERAKPVAETLAGIRVVRFPNLSNWLAWQGKLFFPQGFTNYLQKNIGRFDFVFLSDYRDFQNAIAYQLCLTHQIPYALAAYGQLPIGANTRGPIKHLYDRLWGKKMLAGARYLLAQTDHERKEYLKFGGTKEQVVLLPLGIDAQQLPDVSGQAFRELHQISPDELVLLFVGRINYLKGIDLLVEGLAEIKKTLPKTRLVIVGRDDGYYLGALKKLIDRRGLKKEIVLTGPLYDDQVYPAYRAADVFVFTPRHFEETSLACLTALALGTPVITTKQAPVPFLKDYGAGFEIERSLDEFTQKVHLILGNQKLRQQMSGRAKQLIAEVFDLPRVGARLERLIKEATSDRKG